LLKAAENNHPVSDISDVSEALLGLNLFDVDKHSISNISNSGDDSAHTFQTPLPSLLTTGN